MTVRRVAARLGVMPICVAVGVVVTGLGGPAVAAAPGFNAQITELPGRFTAGGGAETVSAVVSRSAGDGCLKVRWSMVLRVAGLRLNQVSVDRIEETGSFPVDIQAEGDSVRLTDRQVDPGTLCRDRTVTARYRVAVADDVTDGRITIAVEADDAEQRLLAEASATREVVSERAAPAPAGSAPAAPGPTEPEPSESGAAVVEPPVESEDPVLGEEDAAADPDEAAGAGGGRANATEAGGGTGLAQVGFVIGGVLLFLGVGLLLRLWMRTRLTPATATGRNGSGRNGSGRNGQGWDGTGRNGGGRGSDVPARRRQATTVRRSRAW